MRRTAIEDQVERSPSWSRIPAASRASASPETFADVVGKGPTARASARGASWSGTRRPIVGAPPVSAAGQRDLGQPRHDHRQAARPEGAGESRGRGTHDADRRRLRRVVEQQHDPLVGRSLFHLEQPLDRHRRSRARRRSRRPCRSAGRRRRRRAARRWPPPDLRLVGDDPGRHADATIGRSAAAPPAGPLPPPPAASPPAGPPPAMPGPAPRSSARRPRRRAVARCSGRPPAPRPARSASLRRARPRPASRCRSIGRRWPAPPRAGSASGARASGSRDPSRPRGDELEEVRMADGHIGTPGEMGTGQRRHLGRERRLAGAHDLRDRVRDRRDQVVFQARRHAHERRVFIGARVVGADDEPLEVVHVRVQPVLAHPRRRSPARPRRAAACGPASARAGSSRRPASPGSARPGSRRAACRARARARTASRSRPSAR